jgi:hypothetical protein
MSLLRLLSKYLNPHFHGPKRRCLPQQKHIKIEPGLLRPLKPTIHKN